jgi:hypothetical protein
VNPRYAYANLEEGRQAVWKVANFAKGDAARIPLRDKSVDLVLGSPLYCDARTYGIDAQMDPFEWVEWMLAVTEEALRVSKGAVVWVASGVTRDRNYWPACEGLIWEWFKRNARSKPGRRCDVKLFANPGDRVERGSMYRPAYWHRVGIPGSGGDQWFRADVEYCMCFKRPGPLPWADNTAKGHAPRWAPGGEMSHRLSDGQRVNQWGMNVRPDGSLTASSRGSDGGGGDADLLTNRTSKPSHRTTTKKMYARNSDGSRDEGEFYNPPAKANPGNMPHAEWSDGDIWAEDEAGDVVSIDVGGGRLGSRLAHDNEAPYPEKLASFWIDSLCPPDGLVCDPFSGSGTTVSVAARSRRRGIGFDLRQSQCVLGRKRYAKQRTVYDDIGSEGYS